MAHKKVITHPLRQGDLDGLCGVYASLNAILRHHPELDDYDKQCELFKSVVGPVYGINMVDDGAEIAEVLKVLEVLKDKLSKDFKIDIEYKTFPNIDTSIPFATWLKAQKIDFENESLIFGFDGKDSHWSVISNVTANYAWLFDSWEYHKFSLTEFVWSPSPHKTKVIVPVTDLILVR